MMRYVVALTVLAIAQGAMGQIIFQPPADPAPANPYNTKLTADQLARLMVLQHPKFTMEVREDQGGARVYRWESRTAAAQMFRVLPDGRLDLLTPAQEPAAPQTYFRKSDLLREAAPQRVQTWAPEEEPRLPTTRPVDTIRIIIKPALPVATGADEGSVRVARWE